MAAGGKGNTEPVLTGEALIDTKLISALACAAALVLGACSGGNQVAPASAAPDPAASGNTGPDLAPPGNTDPPADDRTPAERFDAAHAKAAADLAAARRMVTAAAATSAGIAAAREALVGSSVRY